MSDVRIPGLVQWSHGEMAPPHTLDILPTDWCNLQCRTCWMRGERYNDDFSSDYQLSDERLLSLINEAAALGVRHIEITGGGEPLMRRKVLLEMMRRIKSKGMEGSMTTNGTLFDEQTVREIVRMKWDSIVFSVDGPDEKTNDWLRPLRGSKESPFSRIVATLKTFKRVKQESRSALPGFAFNVVLSLKNKDRLEKMIRFAAEHGVEMVNFEPMTVHSKLGRELRLSGQDVKTMQPEVERAQAAADKLGIYTNISRFAESSLVTKKNKMPAVYAKDVESSDGGSDGFLSIPCYEPWYHLVVKTDGSVGPCCVFEDKAVNAKDAALADIWTGRFMGGVRAALESRDFLEWCKICNAGQVLQNRGLRDELGKALRKDGSRGNGSRGDTRG